MEMSYSPPEQKKYKQVPVGTHTAICYMIVDIGTQKVTYEGEETLKRQIIIGWETPDETTDDGKPLSIIKTYTLSFNEKAVLAKDYKAWVKDSTPNKFNLGALLGMGCNLNIGITSGGNAKVTGVSALKAKEKVPELVAEPVCFDMRNPSEDALSRLPGFIKEKILASPEYQDYVLNSGKSVGDVLDDQIPF